MSIVLSLKLVLNVVTNSPEAEKTFSASTDVGGMEERTRFIAEVEVVSFPELCTG